MLIVCGNMGKKIMFVAFENLYRIDHIKKLKKKKKIIGGKKKRKKVCPALVPTLNFLTVVYIHTSTLTSSIHEGTVEAEG